MYFPMEGRNTFILRGQCHGWWLPKGTRIQGFSSHYIDQLPPKYDSLNTRRVVLLFFYFKYIRKRAFA